MDTCAVVFHTHRSPWTFLVPFMFFLLIPLFALTFIHEREHLSRRAHRGWLGVIGVIAFGIAAGCWWHDGWIAAELARGGGEDVEGVVEEWVPESDGPIKHGERIGVRTADSLARFGYSSGELGGAYYHRTHGASERIAKGQHVKITAVRGFIAHLEICR